MANLRTRHLALLTLAATLATLARAETSPYYVGVSQSYRHESNLLQLSDGQAAPAGFSQSDTTSATSLLAGFDQPIGRQRLFGNVAVRDNRQSKNGIFDNTAYSLATGLDWETAERISGNLKFNANRNLARFNTEQIGLVTKKNLESTRELEAKVRIGVVTAWTAELTAGHRSVDYSAVDYDGRDFRQDSASVGMRYRASSVSNFGIALRDANGSYPKFRPIGGDTFQADRYKRQDIDFDAALQLSGASNLYARVSPGKITYDLATERNFSGVTGLLKWVWAPTGKLRLDTQLTRDPGQDSYFLASAFSNATVDYSRVSTGLYERADYELTGKISTHASAAYTSRSLTRTLPPQTGIATQTTGSDRYTSLALGATWTPSRALQFGIDLTHDRRRGGAPLSSNLSDSSVTVYGQITLQ